VASNLAINIGGGNVKIMAKMTSINGNGSMLMKAFNQ
jgi:hypothetical protein